MEHITRGTRFLHKNGLVHNDIKPENILVKKLGRKYIFKLSDYGLVTDEGTLGFHGTNIYSHRDKILSENIGQ